MIARIWILLLALLIQPFGAQAESLKNNFWRMETRPTGTTFFFCQSTSCGKGAINSFHLQPDKLYRTLFSFEDHVRAIAHTQLRGLGIETETVISEDKSNYLGHHFTVMERRLFPDGHAEIYLNGYIEANGLTYTLVASSRSGQQTERNYRDLVRYVQSLPNRI